MKNRTAQRIARLGLAGLSAAALTSIGCSLLVTFDDPVQPVADATNDGAPETHDGPLPEADATIDEADAANVEADAAPGEADATNAETDDADATPDVVVDTPTEIGAETPPDTGPEADAVAETPADVTVDATPEVAPDAVAEAAAETPAEAAPETPDDAGAEAGLEAAVDAPAETTVDAIADTSIDAALDTTLDTPVDAPVEVALDAPVEVALDATSETPAGSMAHLRLAQLVNAAAALDFCILPKPSSTTDPDWTAATAVPYSFAHSGSGFAFKAVTSYVDFAPGTYEIRVVAGGKTDCQTEVTPGATFTTPALAAGGFATAVTAGVAGATGATALRVATIVDEAGAAPVGAKLNVRVFNASASLGAIDVGAADPTAVPSTYQVAWKNLPFAAAQATSYPWIPADPNNYIAVPLSGPAPLGLAPTGASGPTVVRTLTYADGSNYSVFVLDDGAATPFFVCNDTTTPLMSAGTATSSCAEL